MREWRCSCGDSTIEPGDGTGLKTIRAHQMGKTGHKILGLYDGPGDDAELLVAGPSRKKAEELGYVTPDPNAKAPAAAKGGSAKKPDKVKTDDGNVELGVPFARMRMKPALWGWVSLVMPMCRQDDGTAYEPTNEGIAQWIYDVVEFFGRYAMSQEYHLELNNARIVQIAQKIRGSTALRVVAEATVPEAEFTNIDDVLTDALGHLEENGNALALSLATTTDTEEEEEDW